jgi:hypothetical protein
MARSSSTSACRAAAARIADSLTPIAHAVETFPGDLGYKREVIGAEREIVTETPCHMLARLKVR